MTQDKISAVNKLKAGQHAVGTMVRVLPTPAVAAMAFHAGLDLIMLDMEHGAFSFEDLSQIALVGHGMGIDVMVRVPELSRGYVSRALDCGADGVMVPMIETAEQAALLASWTKFPPAGKRGLGSAGGHSMYKKPTDTAAFVAQADRKTLAIAQVETITGANNADAIAATPGIDALVIGPNDLAMSLGQPGVLSSPAQDAAMQKIITAALNHKKIIGMHAGTDLLKRWAPGGMTFLINSMDLDALTQGFKKINQETRSLYNS